MITLQQLQEYIDQYIAVNGIAPTTFKFTTNVFNNLPLDTKLYLTINYNIELL